MVFYADDQDRPYLVESKPRMNIKKMYFSKGGSI